MTDTTITYHSGQSLAVRPRAVEHTRRRSPTRVLMRLLHAILTALADEPAVSSMPWIRWP